MKLIKYILNADGSVPNYVVDGGYYAYENGNPSPQDLTLLGVALDTAQENAFNTQQEVVDYFVSIGGNSWVDESNNPIDLESAAAHILSISSS